MNLSWIGWTNVAQRNLLSVHQHSRDNTSNDYRSCSPSPSPPPTRRGPGGFAHVAFNVPDVFEAHNLSRTGQTLVYRVRGDHFHFARILDDEVLLHMAKNTKQANDAKNHWD